MNNLNEYRDAFRGIKPWSGYIPEGFATDFFGVLTDRRFRPDAAIADPELPSLGYRTNGEGWFEAINWLVAARDARERFVMVSLGAHYGAQLVGGHHMLQLINPLPCMLVAVEAEPQNFAWITDHMRDNGIDPTQHWLLPMAVSNSNQPVLFPVGAAGVGSNNCYATNAPDSRKIYADLITRDANPDVAIRSIFANNTTGFAQSVHPDLNKMTEVKFVSALTLADLLGPFNLVDFIEADIQQSEILVFPPFIDLLRKKVRRIHIGTHGKEEHWALHELFAKAGWNMVFSFEPGSRHTGICGEFELNDGVLTVRNPNL